MSTHELMSGDIYKHDGEYYLAIKTDEGFKSFYWTQERIIETHHWWEAEPNYVEYIMNIASCLYDVFDKLEGR